MTPTKHCGQDSNYLMDRRDKIFLKLVIYGTPTLYTFTGENSPRLYFASENGEESEVSGRDRLLKLYRFYRNGK